jgi:hypothetical protein
LISRQFREISRARIEGLLTSFPKLIRDQQQHTMIETDSVRYVYQPIEQLYLVLVTNRQSNILQDLDTLRLLAQVIADQLSDGISAREVSNKAFELAYAFDEVINLGYREHVTCQQVRTIMAMDSHEERIQEIIEKNKEKEASAERRRRAKELDAQRREAAKRGGASGLSPIGNFRGSPSGFGSGSSFISQTTPPSSSIAATKSRDDTPAYARYVVHLIEWT